jgi:hypothetical protein
MLYGEPNAAESGATGTQRRILARLYAYQVIRHAALNRPRIRAMIFGKSKRKAGAGR